MMMVPQMLLGNKRDQNDYRAVMADSLHKQLEPVPASQPYACCFAIVLRPIGARDGGKTYRVLISKKWYAL